MKRIPSIDMARGIVMLIMTLDHVRDFLHADAMTQSPTNIATTTPLLFFTRWVTHLCAPSFVFLSGLSAYLSGERRFLLTRGIWLVIVLLSQGYHFSDLDFGPFKEGKPATGGGLPLSGVYLVWILVVILLFPLCRWYDNYKAAHREKKWLRYC